MMRVELCNAFIVAAGEVLNSELNVQAKRGQLSLQRDSYVTSDVTVLISLVGDVSGVTIFSLSFETAKAMIAIMLGQPADSFDELAQSGIGELGNVISGRASTKLAGLGLHADISIPTLVVGKGTKISTLGVGRLVVPLETALGTLRIDIALCETLNRTPAADGNTPLQVATVK